MESVLKPTTIQTCTHGFWNKNDKDLAMNQKRNGYTIVELLIVVAIISLLLQLALPAVQMSREAARRMACQNNLRQMGVACQTHLSATGRFPTGGWGFAWAGDPDRGNDKQQPGGWIYNILPYLEQQALHDLGNGQTVEAKKVGATKMCLTPLSEFICPSRRRVKAYPFWEFAKLPMWNTNYLEVAAKSDYAANAGDHFSHGRECPPTLAEGDLPAYEWNDPKKPEYNSSLSTGVIYQRSEISPNHVNDVLTHTYLAGEKFIKPSSYKTGDDGGDDQTMYGGFDTDTSRWTVGPEEALLLPLRDEDIDGRQRYRFGSPHLTTCNFLYCDGSVRAVSYSVDGEVHRLAGNRQDGGAEQAPEQQ